MFSDQAKLQQLEEVVQKRLHSFGDGFQSFCLWLLVWLKKEGVSSYRNLLHGKFL